jgi:hypothetical protein
VLVRERPAQHDLQGEPSSCTRGKHTFAVRQILRRAFYFGCTAKEKRTASKLFTVRKEKMHGKDFVCCAFYFFAHGKHFSRTYHYQTLVRKWIRSAFAVRLMKKTRQIGIFAVRF